MARRTRAYRGNQVCWHCQERKAIRRIVSSAGDRYLCAECPSDAPAPRPKTRLMVHDHVRSPESRAAAAFVEARLRALGADRAGADFYVGLRLSNLPAGTLPTVRVSVPGIVHRRQKGKVTAYRVHGHSVDVRVREGLAFPAVARLPVRAVQVKDPVARQLMKQDWFYEWEEVAFRDRAEAWVWGAGFGAFKSLRALDLVPGRAVKTARRQFGLAWLAAFRAERLPATAPTTFGLARPRAMAGA